MVVGLNTVVLEVTLIAGIRFILVSHHFVTHVPASLSYYSVLCPAHWTYTVNRKSLFTLRVSRIFWQRRRKCLSSLYEPVRASCRYACSRNRGYASSAVWAAAPIYTGTSTARRISTCRRNRRPPSCPRATEARRT